MTDRDASPMITARALATSIDRPETRVCDVRWFLGDPERGRREYLGGHIPTAVFVDVDTDLADIGRPGEFGRHPLPDPAAFVARMAASGIGPEHDVVVYDTTGGTVAARLWWMLDCLGFQVRVLEGGLAAWQAAGGAVVAGPGSYPATTIGALPSVWPRTIDRATLRARLGEVTLLDARAANRYRGEVEPVDPVAGHIPTAVSAPVTDHLDAQQRMLPAHELRARFAGLGAADGDVVVSCGSGVSACHLALTMRVAGLPDPMLYPGSYSDWVVSGMASATGPEPGSLPVD